MLFDRSKTADAASVFAAVVISTLPYLFGLGFYSDDWQYQETLVFASRHGLGAMFRKMIDMDPHFLLRPVQLLFFVLGFKAFGRNPTPYHIVISACLGLAACLLYFALRELGIERVWAFAIAMVFGLLPQYSTDRFWISSHQAVLCMLFAFFGIYALLRTVNPERHSSGKWMVAAVAAFVLSILSYEVAIGLIVAAIGIIGWRGYREAGRASRGHWRVVAYTVATAAILMLVWILKAHAQTMVVYHHHLFKHFGLLCRHAISQDVLFNFWTYVLNMPSVLISLYRHSAITWETAVVSSMIALGIAIYMQRSIDPARLPGRAACCKMLVAGLVLFGLGYMLFFPDPNVQFSTAGISNRVVITSALGAACVLVAMVGLLCSIAKSERFRAGAFSVAIAAICGLNCLVVNGIGYFWVNAATQQASILRSVAANVGSLPNGSVLLLDGICTYSGPGIVFDADWDTTGAVRLTLNNDSLSGDVVTPILHFDEAAAEDILAGQPVSRYLYGDRLFLYNVKWRTLVNLRSRDAADAYARAMGSASSSGCPADEYGKL